jgi:hypothetical protein
MSVEYELKYNTYAFNVGAENDGFSSLLFVLAMFRVFLVSCVFVVL